MDKRIVNLEGIRFGKLVVKELSHTNKGAFWNCICDCGNTKIIKSRSLISGDSKSCGCIQKTRFKTHGKTNTPEHSSWHAMKTRCYNVNHSAYHNYGGRGIEICEKWLNFEGFLEDMGLRPSLSHTLERRDNNKNYNKENCYWATKEEQNNNRRNVKLIEFRGEKLTLMQWCRKLNLPPDRIRGRLRRNLPLEKVFLYESLQN